MHTAWKHRTTTQMYTKDRFHRNFHSQLGHTRYISSIYHVYTMYIPVSWRPGPLCGPLSFDSIWPGLPLDLLSLGHSEAAQARLGLSKVLQPGVDHDLVNMAAPPRGRARTIGTAALKSVPLSAAVLMWNSWGCIFVQKVRNDRDSAEEVVNPSDIERGNRRGLVYPVNSFPFHDSSSPQAKFLKGTEANQFKLNVFVWTVVAARHSTYGVQCTLYSGRTAGDA